MASTPYNWPLSLLSMAVIQYSPCTSDIFNMQLMSHTASLLSTSSLITVTPTAQNMAQPQMIRELVGLEVGLASIDINMHLPSHHLMCAHHVIREHHVKTLYLNHNRSSQHKYSWY